MREYIKKEPLIKVQPSTNPRWTGKERWFYTKGFSDMQDIIQKTEGERVIPLPAETKRIMYVFSKSSEMAFTFDYDTHEAEISNFALTVKDNCGNVKLILAREEFIRIEVAEVTEG